MQHKIPIQQFVRRIAAVAIDDRERDSRVKAALDRNENVKVTVKRLPLGDYQANDSLIVERKTLADFARSVRECRLFDQVARLTRQQHLRPCLILEGTAGPSTRLAIPKPAFQGALITVTVVFGLPVLRAETPEETANLILYAANQLQRREVRPPRRRGFKFTGNRRRQLLLLQAIPEVGPIRAKALLGAFGSPSGVASATVNQLTKVSGIGPDTARHVHRVFHDG